MGKLWPVFAGLVILVLLALFLRRQESVSTPPATSPESKVSESTQIPGTAERLALPRPASQAPAQSDVPVQKGKLRVTVETTAGSLSGVIGLVRRDGRSIDQQPIHGELHATTLFESLDPGDYRAFFIPTRDRAPGSADANVIAGSESSVVIPSSLAGVLRGTVVDALMRPLAKVRLSVHVPSALPVTEGATRVLLSGGGGRASVGTGGAGSGSGTWSFAVSSTGSLQLNAITGPDGTFTIGGLTANAVTVEVSFEQAKFSQSFLVNSEARIVVPVQPLADKPEPDLQEFRRTADVLLSRMIEHPETDDLYWTQLKTLIEEWIARPSFPVSDRKAVQESIQKTEELRARLKK